MFYSRDARGQIDGAYAVPQPFKTEVLPDDHPDVIAWRAKLAAPPEPSAAEIFVEAMREKFTAAELDAAKARLMARR